MAKKKFEGKDLQAAFQAAFGITVEEVTPQMVNFFMKMMKHGRTFCRNNSALYNFIQREFKALKYKRVQVKSKFNDGTWEALEITEGKGRKEQAATLSTAPVDPNADADDGE